MEVILSFYFKGYALELPDTPFNIHSVMQCSLLNTEHSFLSEFIWILSSAKDQPVPHCIGQFQSADVFPKWILSFRALCTTKQHNQCQRYKAIILSKAAHSSFVFLRTRYAFYFTSSSSHLQMWNFKCRVLKKKTNRTQHENYRALQSSTICLQFYKRSGERECYMLFTDIHVLKRKITFSTKK